jgi:hypothetical protein
MVERRDERSAALAVEQLAEPDFGAIHVWYLSCVARLGSAAPTSVRSMLRNALGRE